LVLEGRNSTFNPAPPLDPSWLKQRMTTQEYVGLITSLNHTPGQKYRGDGAALPCFLFPTTTSRISSSSSLRTTTRP